MSAEEFVACWKREKESLLAGYMHPDSRSPAPEKMHVAVLIEALKLSPDQAKTLHEILDAVLTDTFYTLLLGLDGAAAIGGVQQEYDVRGEDREGFSGQGRIEGAAWDRFYGEAS